MKRISRYLALSVLVIMTCATSHAQEKLQMKLGYNFNIPVGQFKDFIGNTSFRGFNGEILYPVNQQFSVGVGVSYSDFFQKYPRQVYNTKDGEISAVVTNSVQVVPVLAQVNYNFAKEGTVQPYVRLGAGVNFINYNQYLGEFPDGRTAIKAAVSGDAGVNIPLGRTKTAGLNLGANFNYLPFNYNDVKNLNNWGIHAGVFFPLR